MAEMAKRTWYNIIMDMSGRETCRAFILFTTLESKRGADCANSGDRSRLAGLSSGWWGLGGRIEKEEFDGDYHAEGV